MPRSGVGQSVAIKMKDGREQGNDEHEKRSGIQSPQEGAFLIMLIDGPQTGLEERMGTRRVFEKQKDPSRERERERERESRV